MGEQDEKNKGPSFLGRWFRRLLALALLVTAGLGYGFYHSPRPGPLGAAEPPRHQYPWQDLDGFKQYSCDTFTWAKAEGRKYATEAERLAGEAKEKWDKEWSKEAESLYEKAKGYVAGGQTPGAPAPAAASGGEPAPAPERPAEKPPEEPAKGLAGAPAKPGPDDPPTGPGGPAKPGYYDAYKAGFKAYKDGCAHFVKARPGASKDRLAELKAALASFDEAQAQWEKAQGLRENDARLDALLQELMQYRKECRNQIAKAKAY